MHLLVFKTALKRFVNTVLTMSFYGLRLRLFFFGLNIYFGEPAGRTLKITLQRSLVYFSLSVENKSFKRLLG